MSTKRGQHPDEGVVESDVARLYTLLAGSDSLDGFLNELAGVAADNLDRRLSCGVTVEVNGRVGTVASSDEFARMLDEAQYSTGAGPCLTAMREGRTVDVVDADLGQWPAWRDFAVARGLRKALSTPLRAVDDVVGALNLYSRDEARFTAADRAAAASFAAQAGGAVAVAARLAQQAELVGHLEAALSSRAVIDQAKGILMAQQCCSAQQAFDLLRMASQHRNVKLRDVAQQIVARADRGGADR